jgi:hypothetical protein
MPEIDENGYKAQSIRTCLKIYGSKENEWKWQVSHQSTSQHENHIKDRKIILPAQKQRREEVSTKEISWPKNH